MNEIQAALKTYVIWSWLAKFPHRRKSDYPLFYELMYERYDSWCPLCHMFNDEDNCVATGCVLNVAGNNCFLNRSWFNVWDDVRSSLTAKQTVAGNIAAACWSREGQNSFAACCYLLP